MTNDTPKNKIEKQHVKTSAYTCDKKDYKNVDETLTTKSIKKYRDDKMSSLCCKCCNYTAKTVGNLIYVYIGK